MIRLVTVPHTGTRWMVSCFEASRLEIEWDHFNRIGEGYGDFTLIRNPIDTIRSFLKDGAAAHEIKRILGDCWTRQRRFIEQGGKAFSVHDEPLKRISAWLDIRLVDSGQHYSSPNEAFIPQDLIDWYGQWQS